MSLSQYLPTLLIAIDTAAAVVYIVADGDYKKAIYWVSAAVLTASVTF